MDNNLRHLLISVFLGLVAIALLVYWSRSEGLAGVSPYDTVVMPTVVVETPIPEIPVYVETNIISPSDTISGSIHESPMDVARRERKIICHEAYQEHKEKVVNHDLIVERCATMLTLNFVFESGRGKSRLCSEQFNCTGVKNNRRDRCIKTKGGFCAYSAPIEGYRDWADMYIKHYSGYKTIKEYLNVYDPTHHGTYYTFVSSKYDDILAYFTGKE